MLSDLRPSSVVAASTLFQTVIDVPFDGRLAALTIALAHRSGTFEVSEMCREGFTAFDRFLRSLPNHYVCVELSR